MGEIVEAQENLNTAISERDKVMLEIRTVCSSNEEHYRATLRNLIKAYDHWSRMVDQSFTRLRAAL